MWKLVILTSALLASGWLGMMVSDRQIPLLVHSAKPDGPVKAGGFLRITYEVTRLRQCGVYTERFIYDSRETRFVLSPSIFPLGSGLPGDAVFTSIIYVPSEAHSGPALYQTISQYRCNLLNGFWPIVGNPREVHFDIE